jgi:hypothetical protein
VGGPVRLTDVIRAALGEVEDYQRVTVHDVEPATVIGGTAADEADQLASFTRIAQRGQPTQQPATRPSTGPPPPLAHRDPGAHIPATEPLGVRHTPPAPASHEPSEPPPWVRSPDQARHAATDVYAFLSSFAAGIQRGLDDARDRRRQPPDHPA